MEISAVTTLKLSATTKISCKTTKSSKTSSEYDADTELAASYHVKEASVTVQRQIKCFCFCSCRKSVTCLLCGGSE